MILSEQFFIIYFEFDKNAAWDRTTGSRNKKEAVVIRDFAQQIGLASWYFDYSDGSFLTIDNDDQIALTQIKITYDNAAKSDIGRFDHTIISVTNEFDAKFKAVTGYQ